MPDFKIVSDFRPTGDQPEAIEQLVEGLDARATSTRRCSASPAPARPSRWPTSSSSVQPPDARPRPQQDPGRPALRRVQGVLPAQRRRVLRLLLRLLPARGLHPAHRHLHREGRRHQRGDRQAAPRRHARAASSRRDVLIVASVSCIYGLGSPEEYAEHGRLAAAGRADPPRPGRCATWSTSSTSATTSTSCAASSACAATRLEIFPAYEELAVRVEFFGDEVERIVEVDPLTGEILVERDRDRHLPGQALRDDRGQARSWRSTTSRQELEERLAELRGAGQAARSRSGSSSARATTSRCCRRPATAPASRTTRGTSPRREPGEHALDAARLLPRRLPAVRRRVAHRRCPQVRGMYAGDRARKDVLVELRLPPALGARQPPADLRRVRADASTRSIFVSATPGPVRAASTAEQVVEQIIRPTGLLDPAIEVRPTKGQIDDLLDEINARVERGERALVTTLTKRMAEDLADYLQEMGVRTHYLHSRDRHAGADRDPARPAPRRLRRRRRHQPAARGARPAGGLARRHPRRRQGGLPALRAAR